MAIVADTVLSKDWENSTSSLKNNPLFQFKEQIFTVGQFTDYLQGQKFSFKEAKTDLELKDKFNAFIHQELIRYEDSQLENKHPDFARIIREYHDGILLFNISKDKIWDVASTDSIRLQKFYDSTNKKYYFGDRFKGWILEAKDNEMRDKIETMIDQREVSKQELLDFFNKPTENAIKITDVAVEKGDNPVVDYFIWSGPKPAGFNETTTFVHGKIVQNEQKNLKEAWGLYSSDFQDVVEKEWIESLKKKYPVKINKKVLNKIPTVE